MKSSYSSSQRFVPCKWNAPHLKPMCEDHHGTANPAVRCLHRSAGSHALYANLTTHPLPGAIDIGSNHLASQYDREIFLKKTTAAPATTTTTNGDACASVESLEIAAAGYWYICKSLSASNITPGIKSDQSKRIREPPMECGRRRQESVAIPLRSSQETSSRLYEQGDFLSLDCMSCCYVKHAGVLLCMTKDTGRLEQRRILSSCTR